MEPTDTDTSQPSVAAPETPVHRLERFLQEPPTREIEALLRSLAGSSELDNEVRSAIQSLGSNSAAKADLYQRCLKMCPSDTEIVFKSFFLYNSNGDILDELLNRGRPVQDIHVYGKREAARESCDLSQCALMSDSDRRAAVLRASELLFSSLMPLKQRRIIMCGCPCDGSDKEVLENTRMEQLILRTMQASNLSDVLAVGYFLTKFYFLTASNPKGLLKVFKCLVALGFDPSPTLQSVQHMEGYRACVDYWRRQPQLALKHLARQAVRDAITTNVVHAAPRLGLPASLQSYLLLEDLLAVGEDGEASAEAAERC